MLQRHCQGTRDESTRHICLRCCGSKPNWTRCPRRQAKRLSGPTRRADMLIYLDIETKKFFSDPEIKCLPRAQQIPALAYSFGVAVTYNPAARYWREWYPGDIK